MKYRVIFTYKGILQAGERVLDYAPALKDGLFFHYMTEGDLYIVKDCCDVEAKSVFDASKMVCAELSKMRKTLIGLSLEVLELHQVSYKVDQYIIPIGDPMKQLVGSGI